jgi:hypothetical protein
LQNHIIRSRPALPSGSLASTEVTTTPWPGSRPYFRSYSRVESPNWARAVQAPGAQESLPSPAYWRF